MKFVKNPIAVACFLLVVSLLAGRGPSQAGSAAMGTTLGAALRP